MVLAVESEQMEVKFWQAQLLEWQWQAQAHSEWARTIASIVFMFHLKGSASRLPSCSQWGSKTGKFCNKGWFEYSSCGKWLEKLVLPHYYTLVLRGGFPASVSETSKPSVKTLMSGRNLLFILMTKWLPKPAYLASFFFQGWTHSIKIFKAKLWRYAINNHTKSWS